LDPKLLEFSESLAESQPWLGKIRQGLWKNNRTGKLVDSWELVEEYFPKKQKRKKAYSPFFDGIREQINVKLIDTNRLSAQHELTEGSTVLGCAADMLKQIRMVNADYARRAQKLDQTFPHRLIGVNNSFYSPPEVKRRLKEFESRQAVLSSIGLLAGFEGPIFPTDVDGLSDAKLEAISLFVQDSEAKLSAFDQLSRRCLALLDLINNKFKNKKLTINKEYGLSIEDVYGNPIPMDALSSGEQHEIVITYGLLFKTPANTLLLIDEPEISLHVAWQKSFIKDLLSVAKIVGFECLVATHSPFIVGDNYELMQSLDGEVDA
jgi:predicted ATP-dependent endonuclease of OLD family